MISSLKECEDRVKDDVWAAAIIDGEGCFSDPVDKRTGHKNCRIHVEMTDFDVIRRLQSIMGGNVVYVHYPQHGQKKPRLRWYICKQVDVFNTILRVKPYLSERRNRRSSEFLNYLEPKVVK